MRALLSHRSDFVRLVGINILTPHGLVLYNNIELFIEEIEASGFKSEKDRRKLIMRHRDDI